MVYLERFELLDDEQEYRIAKAQRDKNGGYLENGYPCMLFTKKAFSEIDFEPVTIFCGGNGSGKSTLLNIIALKLGLKRISPYNSSELMQAYAYRCKYFTGCTDEGDEMEIPPASRIITSDDVFEYMLAARSNNDEIREDTEDGKDAYSRLKHGKNIHLNSLDDYEDFRLQVLSRRKSVTRRRFLHEQIGVEVKLNSNGETALDFFDTYIENDTLYCLDEPENSLSPQMQLKLKNLLEEKQRYCDCQFIIATHSPFISCVNNAKIYDLDSTPVDVKAWWELENMRVFYDFFKKNTSLFENNAY